MYGTSWEGAWAFMKGLSALDRDVLPLFQRRDLADMPWVCNFNPHNLFPVCGGASPAQKAGVLAHRIIVRDILLGEQEWGRQKVSKLLGIAPAISTQLLKRISAGGGIPMCSESGVWTLDIGRFREVAVPYKHDIPQGDCVTLYRCADGREEES
jgi:hypothetical protein